MNQREKDIFVITLIAFAISLTPGIFYMTSSLGKEAFFVLTYIGDFIIGIGLGENIRILTRSNWLQNNLKLKIILTVLYSNALLLLSYTYFYLYFTSRGNYIKYHNVFFISAFCISILASSTIIIYLLKKHKKLNSHPA
ncbi:MAG: hypothetical protein WC614_11605 [bacterium]